MTEQPLKCEIVINDIVEHLLGDGFERIVVDDPADVNVNAESILRKHCNPEDKSNYDLVLHNLLKELSIHTSAQASALREALKTVNRLQGVFESEMLTFASYS